MSTLQEDLANSTMIQKIEFTHERRFKLLCTFLENYDYKCIGEYIESSNGWTFFTMETEDERFIRVSFLRSKSLLGVNLIVTGNPSRRLEALIRKEVEEVVQIINAL